MSTAIAITSWAAFLWFTWTAAVIDWKTGLIPPVTLVAMTVTGIIGAVTCEIWASHYMVEAIALVALGHCSWLIMNRANVHLFGRGDVNKLGAICACLGAGATAATFILGGVIALVFALIVHGPNTLPSKSEIRFGPFLGFGASLVLVVELLVI
ncbi:MAG: A24 family peptidase [Roseobacter sp.]